MNKIDQKELERKIEAWVEGVNRNFELDRKLDESLKHVQVCLKNVGDLCEWKNLVHERKTKLERDGFKIWSAIRCAKSELSGNQADTTGTHCLQIGALLNEFFREYLTRIGKKNGRPTTWIHAEAIYRNLKSLGMPTKTMDIYDELPDELKAKVKNINSFRVTLSAKKKEWDRENINPTGSIN